MVRFSRSRGNRLRPVNRIKHVVDVQGAVAAGANTLRTLIVAVDNPTLAVNNEVQNGSTVNGIYLKVEATRTGTTSDVLANVYLFIAKNPGLRRSSCNSSLGPNRR